MTTIISVHSYRGGTGKSNISANVAALLAQSGHRVGVMDVDIRSPGIHVLFGLEPQNIDHTLNDFLWGRCSVDAAIVDVTRAAVPGTPRGRGQVLLVPSSMRTGEIARILKEGYAVEVLNEGIHELCRRLDLDYLIIDTHPGVNEETLLSVAISDTLLMVLRPDQQDYQGTAVTLELAMRLEVPQMLLVVNKVHSSIDAVELKGEIEAAYRSPVACVLPLSDDLVRLGSAAVLAAVTPNAPYVTALRDVLAYLEPRHASAG
ncbi:MULTISPECIES: MinD/ParA family protein [Azorhizobium]|uniref:ParA family protein n=1 Tax=Azorhizobium caulinodans (strain ATCC 43989 / DSM 5975 / JCM 20966 / LMG 6465 / NBRC 14845 / NCIMB 13405 / ORS 571) TaxID=438753 RepID=A8IAZ3_AZOC5|nr:MULTISPECIES: MinD/ParA family protein [Azorhizobium]TDT99748.1 MinD-like ATPase involved in chromosome partitioning or flagellar assembly [Azorhizobium sp. AG788]BAF88583.1 ParA family protein [Azorhizobium caulinodans ORS 571]